MPILWGFQISSQRKLKTISVIKAIFIIFHVLESMGCWTTEQKEANSISMDLLLMNSRSTQTQGQIRIQSLA